MIPAGSQSPHSIRTVRVLLDAVTVTSTWRHAQCAVKADHLAVKVGVVDAVKHQVRKLTRLPEPLGERHGCAERILCLLGKRAQHRRTENPRSDGEHANAELRELPRG